MANDLGTKYNCYNCQAKFYDMKKPDPLCPKCGANPQDSPSLKPSASDRKRAPREVIEPVVAATEEAAEEDPELDDAVPPPEEEVAEEEDLDA